MLNKLKYAGKGGKQEAQVVEVMGDFP